jgi:hypothetical protein
MRQAIPSLCPKIKKAHLQNYIVHMKYKVDEVFHGTYEYTVQLMKKKENINVQAQ